MFGIISDIHGNRPALEAVLADMPDVEVLVCLGDIVGYGPEPRACVELVREVADYVVQGNHDRHVTDPGAYHNPMVVSALRHAQDRLDHYQIRWLVNLPRTCVVEDAYLAVHSHPVEPERRVLPAEYEELRPYADGLDGLLFGHTHYQHAETVDGSLVCNPGSVGQPRDGDPDAAYALVEPETTEATTHRVAYDIDAVEDAVSAADLPIEVAERLREGN